jgi:hypothetical protein
MPQNYPHHKKKENLDKFYIKHQWFMPVILTNLEVDIGRIKISGQTRLKTS